MVVVLGSAQHVRRLLLAALMATTVGGPLAAGDSLAVRLFLQDPGKQVASFIRRDGTQARWYWVDDASTEETLVVRKGHGLNISFGKPPSGLLDELDTALSPSTLSRLGGLRPGIRDCLGPTRASLKIERPGERWSFPLYRGDSQSVGLLTTGPLAEALGRADFPEGWERLGDLYIDRVLMLASNERPVRTLLSSYLVSPTRRPGGHAVRMDVMFLREASTRRWRLRIEADDGSATWVYRPPSETCRDTCSGHWQPPLKALSTSIEWDGWLNECSQSRVGPLPAPFPASRRIFDGAHLVFDLEDEGGKLETIVVPERIIVLPQDGASE